MSILKFALYLLCCASVSAAGRARQDATPLSMVALIASPKEHEGKLVRLTGYISIAFEHNAIYLHREDHDHGLYKNGFWLDASREMMAELQKYNGRYAIIEGVFEPSNPGHGALFSGTVTKINRADPVRR